MTSPFVWKYAGTGHQRTDRRSRIACGLVAARYGFLCREAGYFPDDAAKQGD